MMADTLTSEQPADTESTYLSFANPNYCFEDQINSNFKGNVTSTQEDNGDTNLTPVDDDNTPDNQTNEVIYDNSDASSIDATQSSADRSFILQKLNSPSDDENSEDDASSLVDDDEEEGDDDDEMQHNLLSSCEDVREEELYIPDPKKSRGILGYLAMLEAKAKERQTGLDMPDSPDDGLGTAEEIEPAISERNTTPNEKFEDETDINSPDSNDSGIQSDARSDDGVSHMRGTVSGDDYSPDIKKEENNIITPDNVYEEGSVKETSKDETKTEILPPGWQKHEDEDGPYYWHIKSGTIQRDPPPPAPPDGPTLCTPTMRSISSTSDSSSQSIPSTPTSVTSNTERHLQEFEGHALQYAAKSLQSLVSQPEKRVIAAEEENGGEKTIRFAVRSLGWVRIAEEDLTPERSSKAVNKCIVDLSLGRNDINDAVGRWGDGKDLYMDIDSNSLRLLDPTDGTLLNSQPIHSIRVWGVGRDNGRDFAYVARDRATRMHMCHVFQCDTPARQIANTLRDICKRIMQERGLHPVPVASQRLSRPTDLPNLDKLGQHSTNSFLNTDASFPTPMEEPRKILRCHYLGSHEVIRPTGMDVLNEAIEWLFFHTSPEKWTFVNVAVAPSTITITENVNPENILEECRVRFMSFMGISISSVKLCAFIMHTAQNKFVAHVFHCEPSAGPLCKTIEAACKLRYQKCLDAHHPQTPKSSQNGKRLSLSLKQSVQCVWGSVAQLVSPK